MLLPARQEEHVKVLPDHDVLSQSDPDEIVFSILHQEARSILRCSFAILKVLQPPAEKYRIATNGGSQEVAETIA